MGFFVWLVFFLDLNVNDCLHKENTSKVVCFP